MNKTAGFALLFAVPTVLLALIIVVPAPHYLLWQASVVLTEAALWLVPFALVALILGGVAARQVRVGWLAVVLALVAIGCALVPTLQALPIARRLGGRLSLTRYFVGDRWIQPTINVQRDIVYATVNGRDLRLDYYDPFPARGLDVAAGERLPAVIVVHGGSWSGGEKSDFADYDNWLAQQRLRVFDVEYRLAVNDERFPAQIADVKCAIGWVKQNAAQYGVDPERIALLGRSAGGQLALLAAYTPNDPAITPSCDAGDTSVQAVVSFYAPADLVWGYDHPSNLRVIDSKATLGNYLGGSPASVPATYELAAPIAQVGPGTPPTLLLHGGNDPLVSHIHAERLVTQLQAADVPHEYLYLPWATHGFDYLFDGWGSQLAQERITLFLDTYLNR